MINNYKYVSIVIFVLGVGSLFFSWFIVEQHSEQYSIFEERVENVNANIDRLETSFKTLSHEIRLLHNAVSDNAAINVNGISLGSTSIPSEQGADNTEPGIIEGSISSHNKANLRPDSPTAQELESINLIVDKLRTQDTTVYPDFPALMTSPEISNLSPAAMDKMMAEVSRMFENGELGPTFFPGQ